MQPNVYVYIAVMALVTYLIRVLPLTLIRRQIQNRTIRSFLFYMPYATLAVMTFPAILSATGTPWSALVGLIVAIRRWRNPLLIPGVRPGNQPKIKNNRSPQRAKAFRSP